MASVAVYGADELPTQDPGEGLEIEPPLLIGNRGPDGSIVVPGKSVNAEPADLDLTRLESDLARAKKSAAFGERLYRGGIIAKVEAEERVLKVVRLEAKLAQARLQDAKRNSDGEQNASARQKADPIASAEAAAERASEDQRRAELEAALRNLQRQQKLLALGSGRKVDVSRAEQKLAELKNAQN